MAKLPDTWCSPVIRADFTDDVLWAQLKTAITGPTEDGFEFVEDRTLSGLDEAALVQSFPLAYPSRYRHPVLFVVDGVTIASPEHPILVIDLSEEETEEPFRSTPNQIQAIESNLSICNMDFFEFAEAVDSDGVFRGLQ